MRKKMKYKLNDDVKHFTGTIGKIVKVDKTQKNYKFAYPDSNNLPASSTIEECEIIEKLNINRKFGF